MICMENYCENQLKVCSLCVNIRRAYLAANDAYLIMKGGIATIQLLSMQQLHTFQLVHYN